MHFEYRLVPTLPRLAWCAELRRHMDVAVISHGPAVETRDGFFADGAWDREFANGDLDSADLCMGMGATARGGRWTFVTPNHPMEGLFAFRDSDRLLFSPSLAFLLAVTRSRLDPDLPCYQDIMYGFIGGIRRGVGRLPLADGRYLDVFRLRTIRVGKDLTIEPELKHVPPNFADFGRYRDYLFAKLSALFANAASTDRRIAYSPLCTISSGYDSVASAALASQAGCRDAVTIQSARPTMSAGDDLNDSGRVAGESLGMTVHEFDRDTYRRADGTPEAEFVTAGDLGQDLVLTAFEKQLSSRVVVTGLHGDVVWSRKLPHRPKRDIIRLDPGGASLGEYRMRVGFIHVPVPCIGAMSFPDIFRISRSAEMAPWTLGTKHDRPIPRRIAEERGVPRTAFGQRKRAITVLLNSDERLARQMNPRSLESFNRFYERIRSERRPATQWRYNWGHRAHSLCSRILSRPNDALHWLNLGVSIPNPIPSRFTHDPGRPSFLFLWGMEQLAERYRIP